VKVLCVANDEIDLILINQAAGRRNAFDRRSLLSAESTLILRPPTPPAPLISFAASWAPPSEKAPYRAFGPLIGATRPSFTVPSSSFAAKALTDMA
jgi:hypothetical protein